MATLKNTIINDTGYLQLPSGTNAQRPNLSASITLAGLASNTLGISANGLALTIGGGALGGTNTAWATYQNLPDYLIGLPCTTCINNTDGSNWTLPDCRVYMLRNTSWNAISTPTGWTTISESTDISYISGYSTMGIYYKDFTAGTYSFDNNSAMYMFTYPVTGNSGRLRWNTDRRQMEYYGPSPMAKGGPVGWQAMTTPFLVRSIITNGYVLGGYKDSVAWANVNRTVAATDTTTSLGDLLSRTFNYKNGACSLVSAYVFGAGNGHAINSNLSTAFNMRTEATITIRSAANMATSRGHMGVVFKEHLTAWVTGGESSTIEEFDLTSETFVTFTSATSATGIAGDAGASSGGPWGMSHETYGIWYGTGTITNFTFATRSTSTRAGTSPGNHYQQKSIQSKYSNGYAGDDGSWNGGYAYRRTNFFTNTTATYTGNGKAYTNCGEENYSLGQDWQYMLGQYDGAQNNKAAKFVYSTEVQTTGSATMEPKGTTGATTINGRSSGVCSWRS